MNERAKKYLSDILQAIALIEVFTQGIHSFFDYQTDAKTKSAVERQLGIIGEAVNKFKKEEQENTLRHARQMISFRNRLIHAYDNIDDAIVWSVIKNHIPKLKAEIEKIAIT